MRTILTLLFAAIGLIGSQTGASANEWTVVTRFQVNQAYGDPYRWIRFNQPMNAVRLTAVGGAVRCRRVVATYGDGTSQQIFNGTIPRGEARVMTFDGFRRMNALSFVCRTSATQPVRVRVEARVRGVGAGQQLAQPRRDEFREQQLRRERFRADREPNYFGQDFTRIGLVSFGPRLEREVEYTNFPGRLSAVRFRARGSSIRCLRVVATFGNGSSREIFRGIIRQGGIQQVSFNRNRRVAKLTFVCQSERRDQGRLVISGQYDGDARPQARQSVNWRRLGAARFRRNTDSEQVFARFGGPVQRIGLRPIDDDARCRRIFVTFANGRTRELPFNRTILEEDRLYTFDLPGDQRQVERVTLVCRAFRARDVTIAIYGIAARQPDRFRMNERQQDFGPDWTRIGRVVFGQRLERDVRYTDFPAPVSGIRLRARDSAINCRTVVATFGNGTRREIFSGVIQSGRSRIISFQRDRRVTALNFVCQTLRNRQGVLIISGRYDVRRAGAGGRQAAPGRRQNLDWVRLGRAEFGPRQDAERRFSRFNGPIRRLGFRANNDDARCTRIFATFQNGETRQLQFGRRGILEEDNFYTVDLPGAQRRIQSVTLVCRSLRERRVSIGIFGVR